MKIQWLKKFEKSITLLIFLGAFTSIIISFTVILSILWETIRFFQLISPIEFLFGINWSPQLEEIAGSSGSFGAIPLFAGTLLITLISILTAVPLGLLSAIYLAEYATVYTRTTIKPAIEMLAAIPTVVYGYFAALFVAPLIKSIGYKLGLDIASESALAAGLVMGIMITPLILSISDDVISAIPNNLRHASFALGATRSETIKKVVLPAAIPGIMSAILLAISRAIGETMIVIMASGLNATLTANPLNSVTTVTAQIVSLLVGDQEFDSPKTLAAFALAFTLFAITFLLNIIALSIVRRYKKLYE